MQSFIAHPYWQKVLSIKIADRENHPVNLAVSLPAEKQAEFLTAIASGFYPISYSSPMGFKRVAELTEYSEVREIATNIYEVELGLHPFIKGNWNTNILHCDQFKLTIASLIKNLKITLPRPDDFTINRKLDLRHADMVLALAVCDVIEHTAPAIINFVQDFVAQWQYLTGKPSSEINRTWLDEHNLTEGDATEDQHVGMIERMMKPYAEIVNSVAYMEAKSHYNQRCMEHLDNVYARLLQLVEQPRQALAI